MNVPYYATFRLLTGTIKNLIHIKSKSYQTPEVINDNGCELTDVKAITNAFNDYFSNVE